MDPDGAGGGGLIARERGLTREQVAERRRRFGTNELVPEKKRSTVVSLLISTASDPMVALLLVAGVTYVLIGDVFDAVVAAIALAPIAAVTVVLEFRAERTLAQLKKLTAPTAEVWREGRREVIPVGEIVPEDLVFVKEGDVVAADGSLAEGQQIVVDESALTGESIPVTKDASGDERDLYAGTTVRSGRGVYRVTEIGLQTRYGKIGELVAGIQEPPTPLQRTIHRLVLHLALVAGICCAAVFAIQLAQGSALSEAVIAGVSLGIAAIPEEFPMVFTLYLSLGAWRLAKDRALVRRLAGVETLGSTTVICTDKTGTLTLGQVTVAAVWAEGELVLAGEGSTERARALTRAAVMACEPEPFDPLEEAIVNFAGVEGVDVAQLHSAELVQDYPFDPKHKYMCHVWRDRGGFGVFAKGAPEGILTRSGASEEVRISALAANEELARRGMRLIAVAAGSLADTAGDREADESALTFLGLLAFSDPPRPGVREALADCMAAGIRVVMITGDHPVTAMAVADGLGLPGGEDTVATGEDLDLAEDGVLRELVGRATIFARTRPEQKHRLVKALKERGEVVAMTGDGVNDAPALREADIGVAMGERGTDVARAAATMVLLDDNFSTIVGAVKDGRRIFDNLSRAFSYLVAFHIPMVLAALIVPMTGSPLMLFPIQLILLELVVHPTASLVFEADPPSSDLMRRPPRAPGTGLLGGRDVSFAIAQGVSVAVVSIAVYLIGLNQPGETAATARAVAFASMSVGKALMVLSQRARGVSFWRSSMRGNRMLAPVLISSLAILPILVYVPPLARAMRFAPPSALGWLVAVVTGALSVILLEPFKGLVGRRFAR